MKRHIVVLNPLDTPGGYWSLEQIPPGDNESVANLADRCEPFGWHRTQSLPSDYICPALGIPENMGAWVEVSSTPEHGEGWVVVRGCCPEGAEAILPGAVFEDYTRITWSGKSCVLWARRASEPESIQT